MAKAVLPRLPLLAVFAALGWLCLLIGLGMLRTNGVFEYPLDDVYIHMAMAEQIANGGYGINPGEAASADSSFLYPLLLFPFAGGPVARLIPLFINVGGLVAAAWLWGSIVEKANPDMVIGLALSVLGPIALNMAGIAYLGMEHTLHLAATFALILGLWQTLQRDSGIAVLLIVGAVLGPAVRLEGLGFSGAAALVLIGSGRLRAGVIVGIAALIPVAAFVAQLYAVGLGPLPTSVTLKLAQAGGTLQIDGGFLNSLRQPAGTFLMALVLVLSMFGVAGWRTATGKVAVVAAIAGLMHLAFGRIGWAYRYENYIISGSTAALIPLLVPYLRNLPRGLIALAILIGVPGWLHWRTLWKDGPASSAAVYLQQTQMARFARDYWREPVAVNDIGRVAWQNPSEVVDLYGLASETTFRLRTADDRRVGWADTLLAARQVGLVMIYDWSLPDVVGPNWVRLGTLDLQVPQGFVGGNAVAFYATDKDRVAPILAALDRFIPTLPVGAVFSDEPGLR